MNQENKKEIEVLKNIIDNTKTDINELIKTYTYLYEDHRKMIQKSYKKYSNKDNNLIHIKDINNDLLDYMYYSGYNCCCKGIIDCLKGIL